MSFTFLHPELVLIATLRKAEKKNVFDMSHNIVCIKFYGFTS